MDCQMPHAELEHLLNTHHLRQVSPQCFGVERQFASDLLKTMSNFADGRIIKSPDMYAKHYKKIIGIEHFEYDSSKKTKQGSAERSGIEQANRAFLKEARAAAMRGQDLSRTCIIKTDSSIAALKANFLNNFRKHKRQIDTYESNLKSKFSISDVPIWFLAEDVSAVGVSFYNHFIIDSHPRFPLLPIFYEDVREEILQSSIDGIIFISSFPISNFVVFIANNQSSFLQIAKHYHFDKNSIIDLSDDLPYYFSSFCVQ